MELSRLLRRGLLVAGVTAVGWLLFAGTASADELPAENTQKPAGLLGGLMSTLSDVTIGLTDLTGSVVDTAGDLLSPSVEPPAAEPIVDLPALLPADSSTESGSGSATTDRTDLPRVEPAPVAPVASPVVVPPSAPEITPVAIPVAPAPIAPPPAVPVIPVVQDDGSNNGSDATEHASQRGSHPRPAKAPAAPASSGTTVSTTHDSSGGARGTHGVLTSQATLHPAGAGFTTRSRAVDAAGRTAGLPASSPD